MGMTEKNLILNFGFGGFKELHLRIKFCCSSSHHKENKLMACPSMKPNCFGPEQIFLAGQNVFGWTKR